MDLKEYFEKRGRLLKEEMLPKNLEASGDAIYDFQSVGDFFDMMRSAGYKRLLVNVSVNAGKWIGHKHY